MNRFAPAILAVFVIAILAGCGSPSKVNIGLRKEIQELEGKLAATERERSADMARIAALQGNVSLLPTLPPERLRRMFTVHGIYFGRLTGGVDLDKEKPGDEALRLHITPTDESRGLLKASGSFVIEAFDPAGGEGGPIRVGRWEIGVEEAMKNWQEISWLSRYEYVLTLPWQAAPRGTTLHVQVKFLDELTQAQFSESLDVQVKPPAASGAAMPSTAPSTAVSP